MKKQYARVLKEEGMESTRLSDGPRRRGNIEDEAITEEQRDGKGKETSSASEEEGLERWEPREPTRTRARALSPSDIGPPMPQTSMRELKKQAFARYHSPRFESAARGAGGGVKGKGQPNMGARMGALLERIKRDKTG